MNDEKVFMDYSHKDGPRIIKDPHSSIPTDHHLIPKNDLGISQSLKSLPQHHHQSIKPSSDNFESSEPIASHYSQPWFYGTMTREEASQYLQKYGTIDGVFLVRESHRNPMTYVLSFVFNWKVHHIQIQPVEEKSQQCLSLDSGRTKFYDLLQLVEFYQLNYGVLPTKLTYFLVHPKYNHHNSN